MSRPSASADIIFSDVESRPSLEFVGGKSSNGFEIVSTLTQRYPAVSQSLLEAKGGYLGQASGISEVVMSGTGPEGWRATGRPYIRLISSADTISDLPIGYRGGSRFGLRLLAGLSADFESSEMQLRDDTGVLASWNLTGIPIEPHDLSLGETVVEVRAGPYTVSVDPHVRIDEQPSGRRRPILESRFSVAGIDPQDEMAIDLVWSLIGTDQGPGWYTSQAARLPVSADGPVSDPRFFPSAHLAKFAQYSGRVEASLVHAVPSKFQGLTWEWSGDSGRLIMTKEQVIDLDGLFLTLGPFEVDVTPSEFDEKAWQILIPCEVEDPSMLDSASEWKKVSFDASGVPGSLRIRLDSQIYGQMTIDLDETTMDHFKTSPSSIPLIIRNHRVTNRYSFDLIAPISVVE